MNKSTIVRFMNVGAGFLSAVTPGLAARGLERLFLTPSRLKPRPGDGEWLATAERGAVRFDEERAMPTYAWGEGPVVLLVHGWSARAAHLRPFVEPLVERGFRVVAYDAPAHGEADGRRTGLPELADAVERVAAETGPVHGIVAHSIGGAATTVAVARGLVAERMVYIAPPEDPGNYLARVARFVGFDGRVARRAQARIERRFDVRFDELKGENLAPALRTPLHVIHDRRDPEVPFEEGRKIANAWPGATMTETSGLGHNRILRDPAVVAQAVEFLAAGKAETRRRLAS